MKVNFTQSRSGKVDAIVVGIYKDGKLCEQSKALDEEMGGAIKRAIKANNFKGGVNESLAIISPSGLKANRVLLQGMGSEDKSDEADLYAIGGAIASALMQTPDKSCEILGGDSVAELMAVVEGLLLRAWSFDKYFTTKKDEDKPKLSDITFVTENAKEAKAAFSEVQAVVDGVNFTRTLISEPANVMNPPAMAEQLSTLKKLGVKVEILGEKKLKSLGMGALLGVGQGSNFESQVVVMSWNGGAKKSDAPLAFIGKGVTFDTGGISIKPSDRMWDMKYDMGGAGVVAGLMHALAARKAKVNAIGVVGLVENMPDGNAQRPGDVVKSMSGQTIEVLNTDAEGRLVLADVLWYTQQNFKPKLMVDLATLTGAIVVSLADEYAGLFSNNDEISGRLSAAGEKLDEKVWRFPMHKNYDKMIDSQTADVQNISNGRGAGSITAAHFLKRFVNDVPWAHLDIAGVTWNDKPKSVGGKGASGFGVRLLNRFVRDNYE